jgi:hypothetical protein
MAWHTIKPGDEDTSAASARGGFKIRNLSNPAKTGRYRIRIGNETPENQSIPHGDTDWFECAEKRVSLANTGDCDLDWLRD